MNNIPRAVLATVFSAVCIVMVCSSLTVAIRAVMKPSFDGDDHNNYGVVMDAGSVHTTATVYRWPAAKTNGTGVVQEVFSCEGSADSGISSYASNPRGVGGAVAAGGCLERAVEVVPTALRQRSMLFLGGTAGMRVLNATHPGTAADLMRRASEALDRRGFLKGDGETARFMGSAEEGVLGWITVNYLSGTFNSSNKSIGALDWGGASSQITFQVERSALKGRKAREVSLFGKSYEVFTTSHLCYGQKEAGRRYFVELIYQQYKEHNGSLDFSTPALSAPCQPSGDVYELPASELFFSTCTRRKDKDFQATAEANPKRVFRFRGSSEVGRCDREVAKAFDLRHCQVSYREQHCLDRQELPAPPPNTTFLAFSTYWYLVSALGIPPGRLSEEDFRRAVGKLCTSSYRYAHRLLGSWGAEVEHMSCFKGLFMHHLLTDGYGFDGWNDLNIVKRVSGAEVGWTLGYMLRRTNRLPEVMVVLGADFIGKIGAVIFIGGIGLLIPVITIVACYACKNRSQGSLTALLIP